MGDLPSELLGEKMEGSWEEDESRKWSRVSYLNSGNLLRGRVEKYKSTKVGGRTVTRYFLYLCSTSTVGEKRKEAVSNRAENLIRSFPPSAARFAAGEGTKEGQTKKFDPIERDKKPLSAKGERERKGETKSYRKFFQ